MRIYNKSNRLFQVESGNEVLLIGPRRLLDMDEKFAADITFRMAVQAGDIEELSAAQLAEDPALQQQLKAEEPTAPEAKIRRPDTIEDTEQERKAAVASGKATVKKSAK